MNEVIHTARSHIVRENGPTRLATIEGFSREVRYGLHGGIKDFYQVETVEEHPATLDYIISAIGA